MRQAGTLFIALIAHLGAFAASAPASLPGRAENTTRAARPGCEFLELDRWPEIADVPRRRDVAESDPESAPVQARPAETPHRRRAPAAPPAHHAPEAQGPAEAARAAEPDPKRALTAPIDFTGAEGRSAGSFVVSAAPSTRVGAASRAGRGAGGGAVSRAGARGGYGARGISVTSRRWRCPWPAEADRLFVHRETATVRVCVDQSGALTRAETIRDPGRGFGRAALRCAERASYFPATDDRGEPRSSCAPLVVRFER